MNTGECYKNKTNKKPNQSKKPNAFVSTLELGKIQQQKPTNQPKTLHILLMHAEIRKTNCECSGDQS